MAPASVTRRALVAAAGASAAFPASAEPSAGKKFIFIAAHGGMDGLAALSPLGDPAFTHRARGDAETLDGFFGLHPKLAAFRRLYAKGALLPIHALAWPGAAEAHEEARHALAWTWAPAFAAETGARCAEFAFKSPAHAAAQIARFLNATPTSAAAFLRFEGWDTHARQAERLVIQFGALDAFTAHMRARLGPAWRDTLIAVFTEFGRAARLNPYGGTDHGAGACAFLAGGAVRGGYVMADWPGLAPRALSPGGALRPTRDARVILKSALADHFRLSRHALDMRIFPDAADAPAVHGLLL
ncbi:MAG: DUF1501 domain-containing protein [Hyphomonadaceae bacterium]